MRVKKICIIHFLACAVGYTGNNCDTKCTFPSYGHDCQKTRVCQSEDCNFVSGCRRSLDGTILKIYIQINVNFKSSAYSMITAKQRVIRYTQYYIIFLCSDCEVQVRIFFL